MFNLGNIVNDIETHRRKDIRIANYSKRTIPIKSSRVKINTPKMVDKSTMTEIKTKAISTDTKDLENIAKEKAILERFKKAQIERLEKAALMKSFLGTPKAELYEAEDE